MNIRLTRVGVNPHQLKAKKDVFNEKLMETFGEGIPCYNFCYIKCCTQHQGQSGEDMVTMLWEGKKSYSKLIAKKFALGIVVKKFEKGICWVAFVKKTNTN
jgi:hypothetical protein